MPQSFRLFHRLALSAVAVAMLALAGQPLAATASTGRQATGRIRVLVKVRRHSSKAELRKLLRRLGAREERTLRRLGVHVYRVPRRNAKRAVATLRRSRAVVYAERNRVVMRITSSEAQATPTDPLWGQQWGASLTRAPTAWAVTKGSASIIVAVLDTGVDLAQPDLAGAFVPGYDFVNNDADPSDDFGHGTSVAGIIAARADNGLGASGFCPRCSILPVKVVAADGTATELNVASGITWAVDHGARVVNISLGGDFGSAVASAVDYATGKGVVVVAAAGNNGKSDAFYPAADAGVLSVAASQPDDSLYSWSNYGSWVSVAAPGCGPSTARGGQYVDFCGTSASTPVVSGLAGLAMSFAPNASADAIRHAILSSAHAIRGVAYGRVDVAGTLAALGATFASAPAAPPTAAAAPAPAAAVAVGPAAVGLQAAGASSAQHPHARNHRRRLARAARAQNAWLLRWVRVESFGRRH